MNYLIYELKYDYDAKHFFKILNSLKVKYVCSRSNGIVLHKDNKQRRFNWNQYSDRFIEQHSTMTQLYMIFFDSNEDMILSKLALTEFKEANYDEHLYEHELEE